MKLILSIVTACVLLMNISCGLINKKSSSNNESSLIEDDDKCCVQGVVLNGVTGARLPIAAGDANNSVDVIVRNKVLASGTHINGHDENAPNRLRGEYFVCGIPTNNEFPLFARV